MSSAMENLALQEVGRQGQLWGPVNKPTGQQVKGMSPQALTVSYSTEAQQASLLSYSSLKPSSLTWVLRD